MPALQTAKEKRAARKKVHDQMTAILAAPKGEKGELSAEQRVEFDRMEKEIDTLGADYVEIDVNVSDIATVGTASATGGSISLGDAVDCRCVLQGAIRGLLQPRKRALERLLGLCQYLV